MGSVVASASMSLDGFVAYPDNDPGALFDWYEAGDVEIVNAGDLPPFHLTRESADYWNGWTGRARLPGRRPHCSSTSPTAGRASIRSACRSSCVTHEAPTDWAHAHTGNAHFVTDGHRGGDRAREGDRRRQAPSASPPGTIAGQALAAGLIDEVAIDLVPVVMGERAPLLRGRRSRRRDPARRPDGRHPGDARHAPAVPRPALSPACTTQDASRARQWSDARSTEFRAERGARTPAIVHAGRGDGCRNPALGSLTWRRERITLTVPGPDGDREVGLSSPNRVLWPELGITKHELAEYVIAVSGPFLAANGDRPVSLERFPEGVDGERVLLEEPAEGHARLRRGAVTVTYNSGRRHPQLVLTETAAIVWAVQMNTIVFHPWASLAGDTDNPVELRIDLDPQPRHRTSRMPSAAAHALREVLRRGGARGVGEDERQSRHPRVLPDRADARVPRRAPRGDRRRRASSNGGCPTRSR